MTPQQHSRCCRRGRFGERSQLMACRRCSSCGMPARATTPGTRMSWQVQPRRRLRSCRGRLLLPNPAGRVMAGRTGRLQASGPGWRRAHGAQPCMGLSGSCIEWAMCSVPLLVQQGLM